MVEHTKTPWEVSLVRSVVHGAEYAMVVGGEGPSFGLVAEVTIDADAAFIVKAVNSHDALVKALRDFIDILEGARSGFIPGCGSDIAWQEGRDSRIAEARGILASVGSVEA